MTEEVGVGSNPERFVRQAEAFLSGGDPLPAYDVTRAALAQWPQHVRLRQLHALALMRSGSKDPARTILESLQAEGSVDEETVGLLARLYKDAGLAAADAAARDRWLTQAESLYYRAWMEQRSIWTGINAAVCRALLNQPEAARALAADVDRRSRELLGDPRQDPYWLHATLGEAALLRGDIPEAQRQYAAAARIGTSARRYGDLASSRRNAALVLEACGMSTDLDSLLPPLGIIVFTGHRPDDAGREAARFPAALERQVAVEIRRALESMHAAAGYVSAAAGADLLFIEAMLERGGEVHVMLPFDEQQFIDASIAPSGRDWVARWNRVRDRVTSIVVATPEPLAHPALSYEYANRLLHGLARIRASVVGTEAHGLAVWDPRDPAVPGGTTSAIAAWVEQGLPHRIIDLATLQGQSRAPVSVPRLSTGQNDGLSDALAAFVFCDAVGFSRLRDDQMRPFVEEFLKPVASLTDRMRPAPLLRNTWGDGLFFVFAKPADAARFALELADLMNQLDRNAARLPDDLTLRIGLHAGPVYRCQDPITGAANYFGGHVSRAARIEPITPPGLVYASEPFAALVAASPGAGVRCQYVGRIPLAKQFGSFPMYHVRHV